MVSLASTACGIWTGNADRPSFQTSLMPAYDLGHSELIQARVVPHTDARCAHLRSGTPAHRLRSSGPLEGNNAPGLHAEKAAFRSNRGRQHGIHSNPPDDEPEEVASKVADFEVL